MPQSALISIPSPCPESWEQMAAVSGGRHCELCQKTVHDLSTFSDRELANWLATYTGEAVCGRLRTDQLERRIQQVQVRSEQARTGGWVRWAVALVLGWQTAKGQSEPPRPARSLTSLSPVKPQAKLVTDYHEPALFRVTGQLLNEDSTPLRSARVKNERSGAFVMTDHDGYFQLPIYKSDQATDSLWLEIKGNSRQYDYVKVSTRQEQDSLLITVHSPTPRRDIVGGGLMVVRQEPAPAKRRSFWQFLSGKR